MSTATCYGLALKMRPIPLQSTMIGPNRESYHVALQWEPHVPTENMYVL